MNLVITLTTAGTDTGPFNIYSDVDGYVSAFDINIPKATLLAGFATSNVPDGTTQIRVQSVNDLCNNYVSAGTSPLEYRFNPTGSQYIIDFKDNGSFTYVMGYFDGYFNGSYTVPGNHLVKLQSDGSVDTSFDILEGFNFHFVYTGESFLQQLDGKIVCTGHFTSFNGVSANRIIRLNTDGTRDATFNIGTGFNGYGANVKQDNSGRYIALGQFTTYNGASSPRIVRLLSDGSRDASFNVGSGLSNAGIFSLINNDDSMIITYYGSNYNGTSTALSIVKINADASLDTTFNTNAGTGFNAGNEKPIALARFPEETGFVCSGYFTTYNSVAYGRIVKLNIDGTVDSSFNTGGSGFNGNVGLMWVIWENKLLIIGETFSTYNGTPTSNAIILNQDGSIFLTFSTAYASLYTVGNNLWGQTVGGNNEVIYTYIP